MSMDLELKGKTAFVSGSTAGIGLAIANRLAREGAEVCLNGRTSKRIEEAIARVKKEASDIKLHGIAADLGTAAGCAEVVRQVPAASTSWSTTSAFSSRNHLRRSATTEWEKFFAVNVLSGVRLSRAYLGGMKVTQLGTDRFHLE